MNGSGRILNRSKIGRQQLVVQIVRQPYHTVLTANITVVTIETDNQAIISVML